MHIDLKRDLNSHIAARANNTMANVGLFEKYGFLSPGESISGCIRDKLCCTDLN